MENEIGQNRSSQKKQNHRKQFHDPVAARQGKYNERRYSPKYSLFLYGDLLLDRRLRRVCFIGLRKQNEGRLR